MNPIARDRTFPVSFSSPELKHEIEPHTHTQRPQQDIIRKRAAFRCVGRALLHITSFHRPCCNARSARFKPRRPCTLHSSHTSTCIYIYIYIFVDVRVSNDSHTYTQTVHTYICGDDIRTTPPLHTHKVILRHFSCSIASLNAILRVRTFLLHIHIYVYELPYFF